MSTAIGPACLAAERENSPAADRISLGLGGAPVVDWTTGATSGAIPMPPTCGMGMPGMYSPWVMPQAPHVKIGGLGPQNPQYGPIGEGWKGTGGCIGKPPAHMYGPIARQLLQPTKSMHADIDGDAGRSQGTPTVRTCTA